MPSIAALDRRCFLKPATPSTGTADPRWFRLDRPSPPLATGRDNAERATPEREATPAAA